MVAKQKRKRDHLWDVLRDKRTRVFFIVVMMIVFAFPIVRLLIVKKVDKKVLWRVYHERAYSDKTPVVYLHGMLASVLTDTETGSAMYGDVLLGDTEAARLPIDAETLRENKDNLVATGLLKKFTWVPGFLEYRLFNKMTTMITYAGGFTQRNMSVYVYDWRRDLVEAVEGLDKEIKNLLAKNPRREKVNLLCHSAGGLVARYYVKYGTEDVLDQDPLPQPTYAGARYVDKVVMLGTPNAGSIETFEKIHQGLDLPGIMHASPEVVFTLPALYQVMSYYGDAVFVDRYESVQYVDLYNPENWEKYEWSVFSQDLQEKRKGALIQEFGADEGARKFDEEMATKRRFLRLVLRRAKRFQQALWQGDYENERNAVDYVLIGGNAEKTPHRAILRPSRPGGWVTQFRSWDDDSRDLMYAYGDESVTKNSLLGVRNIPEERRGIEMKKMPSLYDILIFERHAQMMTNATYLDNILHILLDD